MGRPPLSVLFRQTVTKIHQFDGHALFKSKIFARWNRIKNGNNLITSQSKWSEEWWWKWALQDGEIGTVISVPKAHLKSGRILIIVAGEWNGEGFEVVIRHDRAAAVMGFCSKS